MEITIDRAGRLVIPKALRELAGIQPGMTLEVRLTEGKIEIEPPSVEVMPVKKGKRSFLVAPAGTPPLSVDRVRRTIQQIRGERRKAGGLE